MAPQARLASLVNDPHAAPAELADNLIARDRGPIRLLDRSGSRRGGVCGLVVAAQALSQVVFMMGKADKILRHADADVPPAQFILGLDQVQGRAAIARQLRET